ncbi:hypothetical protein SESBI_14559 [Sesbania bispinosa]|nr:hypothetical protein SESBI_14559 [Sesbania bispinosa]
MEQSLGLRYMGLLYFLPPFMDNNGNVCRGTTGDLSERNDGGNVDEVNKHFAEAEDEAIAKGIVGGHGFPLFLDLGSCSRVVLNIVSVYMLAKNERGGSEQGLVIKRGNGGGGKGWEVVNVGSVATMDRDEGEDPLIYL